MVCKKFACSPKYICSLNRSQTINSMLSTQSNEIEKRKHGHLKQIYAMFCFQVALFETAVYHFCVSFLFVAIKMKIWFNHMCVVYNSDWKTTKSCTFVVHYCFSWRSLSFHCCSMICFTPCTSAINGMLTWIRPNFKQCIAIGRVHFRSEYTFIFVCARVCMCVWAFRAPFIETTFTTSLSVFFFWRNT